jgi:type I restriction enzyme M protein
MSTLRTALFEPLRAGYWQLKLPIAEVKPTILGHMEFITFNATVTKLFAKWKQENTPHLKSFTLDGHPKALIETISESLLADFKTAPLIIQTANITR